MPATLTTKRDLQGAPVRDVVARGLDPDHLLVHTTSGSSGEPFTSRRTWLEERLGTAFRLRALRDFGLRATDRLVEIGVLRPHDARDWDLPQRMLRALGVYRKASVECRSAPAEILQRLEELRPDAIVAFPGVVCRITQLITGGRPTTLRPLESQRPEQVPFDLDAEVHLTFDAVAVASRRAMRAHGLAPRAAARPLPDGSGRERMKMGRNSGVGSGMLRVTSRPGENV